MCVCAWVCATGLGEGSGEKLLIFPRGQPSSPVVAKIFGPRIRGIRGRGWLLRCGGCAYVRRVRWCSSARLASAGGKLLLYLPGRWHKADQCGIILAGQQRGNDCNVRIRMGRRLGDGDYCGGGRDFESAELIGARSTDIFMCIVRIMFF